MRNAPLAVVFVSTLALATSVAVAGPNDQAPKYGEAGYSPIDPDAPGFEGSIWKFVPPDTPGVIPIPATADSPVTSQTIYLNRCNLPGSCTFTPGNNDSRENRSSIVDGTATVSPWAHGDQAWDDTVACIENLFAPFNVNVTTVEPEGPHHEAIIAGSPGQIGMPNGVLGVAPFSCGVIHNAITFTFANVASSVQQICATVGQEVAHGWGLDHEFLCQDPMTYLGGCGAKTFQNVDAQCGEFEPRACMCGGSTQNSVQRINAVFADGDPVPPGITITAPVANANVDPGFPIRADVTDPIGVDRVQFFVNGELVGESRGRPFVANAPAELNQGALEVEVVASNMAGAESRSTVTVIHGARCTEGSCPEGQSCWAGGCVDTGGAGGLGSECNDGTDCTSGLCASAGDTQLCTDDCRNGECPSGFDCIESGTREICWPSSSGGCSTTGGTGPLLPVLIGLFGAFLFGVRRRRAE